MSGFNPVFLSKLLDRAGHPTTNDNEALVSIRKASSHCATFGGRTLGEIALVIESDMFLELAALPQKKYLKQIAEAMMERDNLATKLAHVEHDLASLVVAHDDTKVLWTRELDIMRVHSAQMAASLEALQGERDTLLIEVAALRGQVEDAMSELASTRQASSTLDLIAEEPIAEEPIVPSPSLPTIRSYSDLRSAVLAHCNVGWNNWKRYYMDELGTTEDTMKKWRLSDVVPEEAFSIIPLMDQRKFPPKDWTYPENARFRELVLRKEPLANIARIMKEEFSRSSSMLALKKRHDQFSRCRPGILADHV